MFNHQHYAIVSARLSMSKNFWLKTIWTMIMSIIHLYYCRSLIKQLAIFLRKHNRLKSYELKLRIKIMYLLWLLAMAKTVLSNTRIQPASHYSLSSRLNNNKSRLISKKKSRMLYLTTLYWGYRFLSKSRIGKRTSDMAGTF